MTRITLAALVTLFLVTFLQTTAWVSDRDLEKQLSWQYADKVLTLRHFYAGDHLRFRADGALRGSAPVGPWTLDGQIEIKDVHYRGRLLEITARRIELVFDPKNLVNHSPKPVDLLATLDSYSGKLREVLEKYLQQKEVTIEIELPNRKASPEEISSAMHSVFFFPGDSMIDAVPSFWRAYFTDSEGKTYEPPASLGTVYRAEGRVSAPRALKSPPPEYSEEGRRARCEGAVVLWLVVDSTGVPRDLQIQKPLGLGLDEKAVEKIGNWTFEPARKDGQPVAVKINVEASFHLF